jgi:FAD dependent oxidoreductase TIGR03364
MANRARAHDLAVVGAGIVGLAHALAAARRGKRVVVFDRHPHALGASVRNFGFVTVTGQQAGDCWRRARRSRDVWQEIAASAGIRIEHRGLFVVARRPEARAVLEAFRDTEMGAECSLLPPEAARDRCPMLRQGAAAVLWSPHELRIESRDAIPKLGDWLARHHGVAFVRDTAVLAVDPPHLETSSGTFMADACVVCPGDDRLSLFAERLAAYRLTTCTLQMMRLASQPPEWRLPAAVMSDLGLIRYLGYADLPAAGPLRRRLMQEQPDAVAHGVHLIVVQSDDGSLVVGDSHHYADGAEWAVRDDVEAIILDELCAVLAVPVPRPVERWLGTYPHAADRLMLVDRPADAVRVVVVTSGTGASTAFAIAEEVVADLFGSTAGRRETAS